MEIHKFSPKFYENANVIQIFKSAMNNLKINSKHTLTFYPTDRSPVYSI